MGAEDPPRGEILALLASAVVWPEVPVPRLLDRLPPATRPDVEALWARLSSREPRVRARWAAATLGRSLRPPSPRWQSVDPGWVVEALIPEPPAIVGALLERLPRPMDEAVRAGLPAATRRALASGTPAMEAPAAERLWAWFSGRFAPPWPPPGRPGADAPLPALERLSPAERADRLRAVGPVYLERLTDGLGPRALGRVLARGGGGPEVTGAAVPLAGRLDAAGAAWRLELLVGRGDPVRAGPREMRLRLGVLALSEALADRPADKTQRAARLLAPRMGRRLVRWVEALREPPPRGELAALRAALRFRLGGAPAR